MKDSTWIKKRKEKWIQGAVPPENTGKFTALAASHGKTVGQEANAVLKPGSKASPKEKHEAQFAKNMEKLAQRRRKG